MHQVLTARCLITLLVIFILAGCVSTKSPSATIAYYTLEYDPPIVKNHPPLPVALRVERFTVAPLYNTSNMVFREEAFKRDAYSYHRWRANPADLVTHYLSRDLKTSGFFAGVYDTRSRFLSTHAIEGSVDEFFENDNNGAWEAVLALTVTLVAERESDMSKAVLLQRHYRINEPCEEKNPGAVAAAMSRAMAKISEMIIADVYNSLASVIQETPGS
jgi:cholesterol transport system auxiliary component